MKWRFLSVHENINYSKYGGKGDGNPNQSLKMVRFLNVYFGALSIFVFRAHIMELKETCAEAFNILWSQNVIHLNYIFL